MRPCERSIPGLLFLWPCAQVNKLELGRLYNLFRIFGIASVGMTPLCWLLSDLWRLQSLALTRSRTHRNLAVAAALLRSRITIRCRFIWLLLSKSLRTSLHTRDSGFEIGAMKIICLPCEDYWCGVLKPWCWAEFQVFSSVNKITASGSLFWAFLTPKSVKFASPSTNGCLLHGSRQ